MRYSYDRTRRVGYSYDRTAAGKVVQVDKVKKELDSAANDLAQIRQSVQELMGLLGDVEKGEALDKAKDQLGTTADAMIRVRGDLRDLRSLLGDIQFDDSGKVYTDNVDNPILRSVRDKLRDLDDELGVSSQLDYVREHVAPAPAKKLRDQLRGLSDALGVTTQLDHLRTKVLPALLVKNS